MSLPAVAPEVLAGVALSSTALAGSLAVATRPGAVNARRVAPESLSDCLPWAALLRPGVVVNKDGSLMAHLRYRGPDLSIADLSARLAITAQLNRVLGELDGQWSLYVEAARLPAVDYPEVSADEPLARAVDAERQSHFTEAGFAYETQQTLTLLYTPPVDAQQRWRRWFVQSVPTASTATKPAEEGTAEEEGGNDAPRYDLTLFEDTVARVEAGLRGLCPVVERLTGEAALSYLQSTVDPSRRPVALPPGALYLDAVLSPSDLATGFTPKLGEEHLRVVGIRNYPTELGLNAMDALEGLGFAYRWVTRFILTSQATAESTLRRTRRRWFAQRKSVGSLIREAAFSEPTPFEDSHAVGQATDADAALAELKSGAVRFGWFTAAVVVSDPDPERADAMARNVEFQLLLAGFLARVETVNAVDAWFGTLPGITAANVRKPLLNSLNVARLMPLHCTWAGPEEDTHLKAPPLFHAVTAGRTPFRFSAHFGDVGHTLVLGPTGQGKSTLLNFMALQALRYPDLRVIYFDKGRSARAVTLGCNGAHVDLGDPESVSLQPLANIDALPEQQWAVQWLAQRLAGEGIEPSATVKARIRGAIETLASRPANERTLTACQLVIQDPELRQALTPFTTAGGGTLLDGDADTLPDARWQTYELESLLESEQLRAAVLEVIFHRIEQSLDGRPTMIVIDEGWRVLADLAFKERLHAWLKTLRKHNAWLVFASQSLDDVAQSELTATLSESAPIRIFLPNPRANEPATAALYEQFGLTDIERDVLSQAVGKREYYVKTPEGSRLFELGLSDLALAFCGAGSPADQKLIDEVLASGQSFAQAFAARKNVLPQSDLALEACP